MDIKQSPIDYIVGGSVSAAGVITKATLTAVYTGVRKVLFSHGLQQLHLDFVYTPQAAQTTRYIEATIEHLDEYDNVVGSHEVVIPASTEVEVFTNRQSLMPVIVPGEKSEATGQTIIASFNTNIMSYKVRISLRENDSGGTPTTNFGAVFCKALLLY